jgi:UDP-N-acetylmuramoyl-L-alanyl-D-glutamate--2,6-diaminopimelate ligase
VKTLGELLGAAYPGRALPEGVLDVRIRGVECDSRKIDKDFLFIAVRGVKVDGAAFIEEAISRGAAAIVGESLPGALNAYRVPFIRVEESRIAVARLAAAFYGNPASALRVVGITGTNGKTTSSYLVEHLLASQKARVGVIGTVNYRYAGKEIPARETTPGPLAIQGIFSEMVASGCDYAVMEVSSHALDQRRVEGIHFAGALFTNLTQDHLDYHKTIEAYFEAKARLFESLKADAFAVLNADDPWAMRLKGCTRAKVVTYGVDAPADFQAKNLHWSLDSTRFDLALEGNLLPAESPMPGLHNVYNALGSLALTATLGYDVPSACADLVSFKGVPGRLEAVKEGQDFHVFIDFAHTPDGLDNVLKSLTPYKKRKLIGVFGCGGDRDRGKRPQMAEISSRYCDSIIVTSDNPRTENPRAIADEIVAGFPSGFDKFSVTLDRRKAIRQALLAARADDIVVIAGKGHERTQIVGTEALPFSDRQEAERVLNGR